MSKNIRDQLNSMNSMTQYHSDDNVKWVPIVKTATPIKIPRGRGVMPVELETRNSNSSGSSRSTHPNKKHYKNKKANKKMNEPSSSHQFSHITPDVREANGGWNTQSNEAIERRAREIKKRFIEENMNSGDSCNVTSSSESSASYRTTLQDSYEIRRAYSEQVTSNEEVTSETLPITNLQRYKKNALMLGLLRSAECTDVERDDTTASSSEEYYESNSFDDVASGMTNLNIDDENVLQSERIGRFFQSQEDEDVYCHPLREQIQKDPDWQRHRLKRKGTETIMSSRQFFLSINDDEFAFEPRNPN